MFKGESSNFNIFIFWSVYLLSFFLFSFFFLIFFIGTVSFLSFFFLKKINKIYNDGPKFERKKKTTRNFSSF